MARSPEENRELARLRRRASRLGLGHRILSSRWRQDTIDNLGGYAIVNNRDIVVAGDRYDLSLEAVSELLANEEREALYSLDDLRAALRDASAEYNNGVRLVAVKTKANRIVVGRSLKGTSEKYDYRYPGVIVRVSKRTRWINAADMAAYVEMTTPIGNAALAPQRDVAGIVDAEVAG